jgi:hypothetical protein
MGRKVFFFFILIFKILCKQVMTVCLKMSLFHTSILFTLEKYIYWKIKHASRWNDLFKVKKKHKCVISHFWQAQSWWEDRCLEQTIIEKKTSFHYRHIFHRLFHDSAFATDLYIYIYINDKRSIVWFSLYNLLILLIILKKHFGDEYFLPLIFFFGRSHMSLIIVRKTTTGSDEDDKCIECWWTIASIGKKKNYHNVYLLFFSIQGVYMSVRMHIRLNDWKWMSSALKKLEKERKFKSDVKRSRRC